LIDINIFKIKASYTLSIVPKFVEIIEIHNTQLPGEIGLIPLLGMLETQSETQLETQSEKMF